MGQTVSNAAETRTNIKSLTQKINNVDTTALRTITDQTLRNRRRTKLKVNYAN